MSNKIRNAKLEMESYRVLMRNAKTHIEYGDYKRDFIKARNRYYNLLDELKDSVRGKNERK